MLPTIKDLGIDQMDVEQRLRLIGEIWDSLSLDSTPIPDSHRAELDRRLLAAEKDPDGAVPWQVVRARLRGET
jgi:putative addiction module component (TIGR02574 family)